MGAGTTCRTSRLMYWSMRVMAMLGVAMFLIAAVGAWLYRKRKLHTTRWFLWIAVVAIVVPVHRRDRRLDPDRDGPPAVDRAEPAEDLRRRLHGLSTATVAVSLTVFVLLYAALGVVDFVLMRHYARLDPPGRRATSGREVHDMGLEEVWFVLIGVLWSGYFLLEGFDFGVGMLLPFLPRDERERGLMFESIGPVWDGNEVWLVVAAGATFAAFPAWYATLFSGFYVALLLILVLLIVRVRLVRVAREARGRALAGDVAVGEHDRERRRPVPLGSRARQPRRRASRSTPRTCSPAGLSTCSPPTRCSPGSRSCAMFALHGATYLTLRTAGDLRERAARTARRLAAPAIVLGGGVAAWTVRRRARQNDRAILPTTIPAVLDRDRVGPRAGRSPHRTKRLGVHGHGTGRDRLIATIFTGLYPRVLVSDPDFANSLTISNAATGHYALQVITVAAAIFTPLILLYQGWTYYVFRKRIGGDRAGGSYGSLGAGKR